MTTLSDNGQTAVANSLPQAGLLELLVDPKDRSKKLHLEGQTLISEAGNQYSVVQGIPRFVTAKDSGQLQTADSFGYKWNKQSDWGFKPEHDPVVWSIWRDFYGWEGPDELKALMSGKRVLDAGCGSGASLKQYVDWPAEVFAADISNAVDACRKNFQNREHCRFIQADLMNLPFPDEVFDIVWSNGVLHHTPNTFEALRAITRHARKGGLVIFYIYVKKAPIREFVDDYLRDIISPMNPDQAWERMEAFTRLSKNLSEMRANVTIEEDFPELGIKKGTYDIQRFIYYHIFKCFWNDGLSFDDNVNVNFDWYHPTYSHRHSPEEVRGWLETLSLKSLSFHQSESGIAVIAEKG
jgi:arsenite methyltransferase